MDEFDRNPRDRSNRRDKPQPRKRTKAESSGASNSSRRKAASSKNPQKRSTRNKSGSQPTKRTNAQGPGKAVRSGSSRPRPQGTRAPAKGRRQGPPRKPARGSKQSSRARRIWRRVGIGAAFTIIAALIVGGVAYAAIERSLPDITGEARGTDQTSVIYDRNGEILAKLFAEQNRTQRSIEEIPVELRQAVIATEDQRFYEHNGVDPLGIARALWVDVTQGKRHGGSTITQQYVVNAFVERESTISRKVKEAVLAYRLEKGHSKDEILELYLNTIYFGHGAYGVEAASQAYFGKPVTDLSLSECAMIAGVIKSPGRYSPYLDADAAADRHATVLSQMADQGFISAEEQSAAAAEEFALAGLADNSALAPYFVEYIKAQLIDEYGADMVFRSGISVKTTLDLRLQNAAEKAVSESLDQDGDPSAALVALDPTTGEILAMVGGTDFATQQFNVAVQGRRQPGSAFKPFVLATALAEGISPEQAYEAGPASLKLPNGQTWKVTGSRKGLMRLREATAKSVNSVFAQLMLEIGPEKVVETVEKMGLHEGITPVPAIALGGMEEGVSPLEMASAYGTLAAAGTHAEPYGLTEVTDGAGDVVFSAETSTTQAIDPGVAYLATDIMRGVITEGTGRAAGIGRAAAGKTGTTQEYRDAWFVGYTPQISCAVWVGHPDGQIEMKNVHGRKVTGGSFPAEIWHDFMAVAHEDREKIAFSKPAGLTNASVCRDTGMKATEWCESTFSPLFLADHVPSDPCTVHTGPEEIDIPSLIGMTKEAAIALLKQLMLLFEVVESDVKGVPAGIVAKQSPKAGSVGTTETVVTITVSNGGGLDLAPVASFVYDPPAPLVDQPVAFDASASSDDKKIVTYYWEFGDGFEGEGKKTTYSYSDPGTFEVTLWVTDDSGQTASVTKTIVVQ